MKIYEFRIILPTKLEKYDVGHRYMNLQYVHDEGKNEGEGIELVKNEPYTKDGESGQYTYKIFHLTSKVPEFIRWAVPNKYLHFHEESWSGFPHYHTVNFVPQLGDDLVLDVESTHIEYKKGMEIPNNLMNLSEDDLKKRKIKYIDIVDGDPQPSDKSQIIEGFVCPEAGIMSPLKGKHGSYDPSQVPVWVNNYNGDMMCCIKVVKFHFKKFGLQTAVEKYIMHTLYPKIFVESHRKLISTSKSWFPLTMDDILRMENETKQHQDNNGGFNTEENDEP